ncbi:MAG: DNA polymerase [Candidatus Bathyarchaeia archaeon]
MLDSQISKLQDAYIRVLMPSRGRKAIKDPVIIGWDTEFDQKGLICMVFSVKGPSGPYNEIFYKDGSLTTDEFLSLLEGFLGRACLKGSKIYLVSHFAQSELKHLSDLWERFRLKMINRSLFGELSTEKYRLRVIDLFSFYPMSLEKIANSLGLAKISLGIDGKDEAYWKQNMRELLERHPEKFEQYAKRDAELVLEIFTELREMMIEVWGIDVLDSMSFANLSGQIFRCRFLREPVEPCTYEWVTSSRKNGSFWKTVWQRMWVYTGSRDKRYFALRCYWGGRREAFGRGLLSEDVEIWDVKSMYPHMSLLPLPMKDTKWEHLYGFDVFENPEGIGFVHCNFEFPENCQYPCLPVYDSRFPKLIFPLKGETWCTMDELRLGIKMDARVHDIEAWVFYPEGSERNHPLRKFMMHFLEQKKKLTEGSLEYVTCKLIMNALVGKLCQRNEELDLSIYQGLLEDLKFDFSIFREIINSPRLRHQIKGPVQVGSLWSPEWASIILGRARALISELMASSQALGGHTDSIIVRKGANINCEALELLRSLGSDLELKATGDKFWQSRSALYVLWEKGRLIKEAHHGVPVDKIEDFVTIIERNLSMGQAVEHTSQKVHLTSPKEALKGGLSLGEPVQKGYEITWQWDFKRRLEGNGDPWKGWSGTKPWESLEEAIRTLGSMNPRNQVFRGPDIQRGRPRSQNQEFLRRIQDLRSQGLSLREIVLRTGLSLGMVQRLLKK